MRIRAKAIRVVGISVLMGGMFYSVLALTLITQKAYAQTCDCSESYEAAEGWCAAFGFGQLASFECPTGPSNPPEQYTFTCTGHSEPLISDCGN
jgi:hypothetical protein